METFRIAVPQRDLDDLYDRLDRTRWPAGFPDDDWAYGVPGRYVRELAEHWRHGYDWRRTEARLNAYPQFRTVIDGQPIHFLHVRSERPDALPLVLTHGWPGSVAEFLDVIGPLSRDFHLVVPSLPGFGFSGPTHERGWNVTRIAYAWVELMRSLGYQRFGAAGNDWGSTISPEIGRIAPEAVAGVHVTQIWTETDEPIEDPTHGRERDPHLQRILATTHQVGQKGGAPLGYAQFKDDYQPIRRLAPAVTSWHKYDTGGHFAAHQTPDLVVKDLTEFFADLK